MMKRKKITYTSIKEKTLLLFTSCFLLLCFTGCQAIEPNSSPTVISQPLPVAIIGVPLNNPPGATVTATTQDPAQETQQLTTSVQAIDQTTVTPTPILYAEDFWKDLPVIPTEISDRVREVYKKGQELGNDPRSFTKVGDCNSNHPDFLSGFDHTYYLGEYEYLQPAIDYFKGSFGRLAQTINPGVTTSRILGSLWKTENCPASDSLLECQYRIDNPSFVIIALGTNDAYYHHGNPENFERNMRAIIEISLERGIVPILMTKADNNEKDNSINPIIARLALEYEIPLLNFWKAAQSLYNQGLKPDLEHLNSGSGPPATDFRMPISLSYGKEVKNLTSLQTLNFLMEQLGEPGIVITLTETP